MKAKMKNTFSSALKLCLAIGLITWLVKSGKVNFSALSALLSAENFFICFIILLTNLALASERWRRLLSTQVDGYGFFKTFKLTLIGQFFNFAMPGGVGGDVIKAYYFAKDNPQNGRTVAITSVLIDRVLGLYAMIIFALSVMCLDVQHIVHTPALRTLLVLVSTLFVGFSIALSLLFSIKLYESKKLHQLFAKLPMADKINKLYESFHYYGNQGQRVFIAIILSLASQFFAVLFLYFTAHATGFGDIPFYTFLLVAPIGFMATAIPISPAGVGVGQAAFFYLFSLYLGKPSDVGAVTITAFQVANFLFGLIGAGFYISRKDKNIDVNGLQSTN